MDTRTLMIRQQLDRRAYVTQANRLLERSGDALKRRSGWHDTALYCNPAPFVRGSVLVFGASGQGNTTAGQ